MSSARGVAARRGAGPRRVRAVRKAPALESPRAAARVRGCVVVARLRGLSALVGRLEPQRVMRLLDEVFAAMTDVAVAQRAAIDRLLGETIVLFYGLPAPGRDDALRAVRTAMDMQRAFLALRNRWAKAGGVGSPGLGLAIGVAAGEVLVAGRPGQWLDYAAVGKPVDVAVQLCAAARGAETLVDDAVHGSVADRVEDDLIFTSRALPGGAGLSAYRVAPSRGSLHAVPRPGAHPR